MSKELLVEKCRADRPRKYFVSRRSFSIAINIQLETSGSGIRYAFGSIVIFQPLFQKTVRLPEGRVSVEYQEHCIPPGARPLRRARNTVYLDWVRHVVKAERHGGFEIAKHIRVAVMANNWQMRIITTIRIYAPSEPM